MAVRNKKYIIRLNADERQMLGKLARSGRAAARKITRARVLLKADAGEGGPGWTDERIAEALDVGVRMIEKHERRFLLSPDASRVTTMSTNVMVWPTCSCFASRWEAGDVRASRIAAPSLIGRSRSKTLSM